MERDLSQGVDAGESSGIHPRLTVALLGGPGSGKGTQAELLSHALGLPHIATGDLFRENLERHTPVGDLAKTYMDRGALVPDAVTDELVEERISRQDARNGFILDGFPRTLPQAQALRELLTELGTGLSAVIYLRVPDETIVERLGGRWICHLCQAPYHTLFKAPIKPGICDVCGGALCQREDDKPATVRARLKTFHGQTEPLVLFYRRNGLLLEVDGNGGVATVSSRIRRALDLPTMPGPALKSESLALLA